jgi:hypothetical protein
MLGLFVEMGVSLNVEENPISKRHGGQTNAKEQIECGRGCISGLLGAQVRYRTRS